MNDTYERFSPGDSLSRVLPAMLLDAGVVGVTVEKLTKAPSFRGGSVSDRAQAITAPARAEHRERGFGFWEFVLERALDTDRETRQALLRGALSHSPAEMDQRFTMSVADFGDSLASGQWAGLPPRSMVNLCSTVQTADGRAQQLVLLDFGIPASRPGNRQAAIDALKVLDLSGALFASGRSFHFVSGRVAEADSARRVLARAQLLSPVVDARWVSHQMIDGEARLRISTDAERNTTPHRLVGWI